MHIYWHTHTYMYVCTHGDFPGGISGKKKKKNLPASAGDIRDSGSILSVLQRSPGEGHGNPLQYSCLESPMDTVHRVTQS